MNIHRKFRDKVQRPDPALTGAVLNKITINRFKKNNFYESD